MHQIVKQSVTPISLDQSQRMDNNIHPPTPINFAYLELQGKQPNSGYLGRNLNFHHPTNQDNELEDLLKWDEELEIEQAREEIASLESENAELPLQRKNQNLPFNYWKKSRLDISKIRNNYENDMAPGIPFDDSYSKTFQNKQITENFIYVTYTDSQKSEEDGEPLVEYVNPQSILNQYNPYTRTFFKWSIYSPSNRLYTVDEVNSNISDPEISSHFRFSNKNQDSMNLTNSMILPWTPTPKVSKVMHTRRIRTKTDKQDQKMNLTYFEPNKAPTSAKFLFKTVSTLPSNKSRDLGSPAIPLNSIVFPKQKMKSSKNLNSSPNFISTKVINNKIIKLSPEKNLKVSPKKKVGATRNISCGDIKHIYKDGSSGSSAIANDDIQTPVIPNWDSNKYKSPISNKSQSRLDSQLVSDTGRMTFEPLKSDSVPKTPRYGLIV